MKKTRRDFLKLAGIAGIGFTSTNIFNTYASARYDKGKLNKVIVDHAVATLNDGSVLSTPFWRIESGKDGPSLLLIAAQHGNELQGAEVARRLQEICARQLIAGSVWLLPMADLRAIRSRRYTAESLPEKRVTETNLQQSWPGNPEGLDNERVAYSIEQTILRYCSEAVDMHCWEHHRAAESLVHDDHAPSFLMGEVTTTRFISYSSTPVRERMNLRQLMQSRGGGAITIELSGQYQMQERQVQTGLGSMINILKRLNMIAGEPELIEGPRALRNKDTSHEVHAPCSGIFMPDVQKETKLPLTPDNYIREGQSLGHIIRETDLATVSIIAPVSGYLWQYGLCHWGLCDASLPAQHPYAEEGDRIATVVTV